LLNKELAYYVYKENTYDLLITYLSSNKNNSEEICLSVLNFIHDNLFTPTGGGIDKDFYNDLIIGASWCDQRAWGLGTLVGRIGIENRTVMTMNPEEVSCHTVSEILINKKWRYFGPLWGIVIYDKGELASYEDICNNPSLFYTHPEMMKLKYIDEGFYNRIKEFYTTNVFYKNPKPPTIWGNPIKKRDLKRRFIRAILDINRFILKEKFLFLFQDIYLNYVIDGKGQNLLYIKARNYDLYMRYRKAAYYYDRFINTCPENPDIENALFFYGIMLNKNKSYRASINVLELLLEKYSDSKKHPDSKWKTIAYYYLGYNYELLGDNDAAKKFYWIVINIRKASSESPHETDVIERLYNLMVKS
jgi:tetratricopeptide (TPR) repeat protein